MSATAICTNVNNEANRKPEDNGDASTMAESDVLSHSARLHDTETEGDTVEEVVMCVVWGGCKLGLSFYSVDTGYLHTMCDVAEAEDFGLMKRVLAQVEPKVVVVSSKVDERLLRILRAYETPEEGTGDTSSRAAKVEILPSSDFKLETCKHRVFASNLPGVPVHATADQRHVLVSSLLCMESQNMIRSVGVLLKYVEKKRLGVELEDTSVAVPILALRTFSLDQLVVMDENSYTALQIFQKESHPSVYKEGGGAKEGLSLFGIMNKTKSPLGARTLRLWFQRPLRDIPSLQQRLDAVGFLALPRNTELANNIQECLKHIKNIPRILARMETAQCSINDWQALYKTVYNAIFIGDMCRGLSENISIFRRIAVTFSDELPRVASLISQIIDFDESTLHNRFVVKPNIDAELDEKKWLYNGLPDLMTQVAEEELAKLPDDITQCTIIYVPQLGFLLAIPRAENMVEERDFVVPGLEFVFLSNNMVHYKTNHTKELDAQLGDTQCEITDRETMIMHRLQTVILEQTNILLSTVELCAELDCLLALAMFARENNCVRPELGEDPGVYIKAGRHPLQELCVTTFVPNDTCIDLKHGRMKILTGPNASGKSVYLKQVGLLVFMAHLGSFVPAEVALIGMVDRIFTRIRTRETVSVGLSTFMVDLNQVAAALRESSEKSLILLDEYGKGTATVDGLALLTASLRHWVAKGALCPAVLISTHFHGLVKQKLLPDTELVEYLTMDTLRDGDDLIFLYQLIPGLSDISYACHIAAHVGLPANIVKRAAEVSELIRGNKPIGQAGGPGLKRQLQVCEAVVSRFLELDLDADDITSFLKDFVIPTADNIGLL